MPEAAKQAKTVVIVGASDKPDRTSYQLLERLRAKSGYRPVPVHPKLKEIQGVSVLSSLAEAAPNPDVVSLYVGPAISGAMEAELKRLRPGKVIFNPGAENPPLEESLRGAGIDTEAACSLVLLSQNAL